MEPHRDVEKSYPKKNRFQQAQIDKNYLNSGDNDFSHLPELYIVSITNYDPFGYDQMLYVVENQCVNVPDLEYNDGVHIMYFNTKGTKGGSGALKSFLTYLEDSRDENVTDDATKELKEYVQVIKHNHEIGGRYMTVGDLMDKMAAEAAEEATKEVVEELTRQYSKQLAEKDKEFAEMRKELTDKDEEIAELRRLVDELNYK